MTFRQFAGSVLALGYNSMLSSVPLAWVRQSYLKLYLKKLGVRTGVQMRCRFLNGQRVSLGNYNVINFGCLFDGRKFDIRIGDNVSIGPEATILTLGHDPQSPVFADRGGEVIIGDRVWIGYRAIILPGVTIGEGAVVAAGAVVTRNVDAFTIVAGVPAKPIGLRHRDLQYQLDFTPLFL